MIHETDTSVPAAPHMVATTLTFNELCIIHVALASLPKARPEFAVRHESLLQGTSSRVAVAIVGAA
jgi:hypothetical protein